MVSVYRYIFVALCAVYLTMAVKGLIKYPRQMGELQKLSLGSLQGFLKEKRMHGFVLLCGIFDNAISYSH